MGGELSWPALLGLFFIEFPTAQKREEGEVAEAGVMGVLKRKSSFALEERLRGVKATDGERLDSTAGEL